jgi:hypothetical protein
LPVDRFPQVDVLVATPKSLRIPVMSALLGPPATSASRRFVWAPRNTNPEIIGTLNRKINAALT